MTRKPYAPVLPREHDRECRYDRYGWRWGGSLDGEKCERCRNLLRRLEQAHARNVARDAS